MKSRRETGEQDAHGDSAAREAGARKTRRSAPHPGAEIRKGHHAIPRACRPRLRGDGARSGATSTNGASWRRSKRPSAIAA